MSLLCEMLAGQLERQGREFEEINSAIASGRKQEERGHATPGDIGPEMLA